MTRLKPRQGSYDEALLAFRAGDFSFSLDLLANDESPTAALLSARSFMRLGEPRRALDIIESLPLLDFGHELGAEALAIKSLAFVALGRFEDAAAIAIDARARCFSSGNVAIEAELLFADSLSAMIQGDAVAAERSAHRILELENHEPRWVEQSSYSLSLDFWRFRACDFLGGLEHSRGNDRNQAMWRERAFAEFDKAAIRDDFLEASLLANYAESASSLGLSAVDQFVLERAKRISWTVSLAGLEFRVFSALAEASSIAGDQLGALRYFRRCSNCAPSAPLQIRASVERARIFSEIGESYSSREELDHAVRLTKSVDWQDVEAIDQSQLLFLAAQVASFSGKEAQRLLNLYDGLRVSAKIGVVVKNDRLRGEELYARAVVLCSNGHIERARTALVEAFEIWTAAGLVSAAARATAKLSQLAGEADCQIAFRPEFKM